MIGETAQAGPLKKGLFWKWPGTIWLALAAGIAAAGYLAASMLVYSPGYPLDDAWIHQTYARNLGWHGEWAYLSGQPSGGSTSPLWTVLLAIGYVLRIPHLVWTNLLGGASLIAVAWAGETLLRDYLPDWKSRIPLAGVFLAGEWHLVWASVSGMETLLNAALVLVVLRLAGRARGSGWGWIGLLTGLGVWVRPDAVTLLGPAVVMLLMLEKQWKPKPLGLIWLLGGFGICFGPYLLFNFIVQGSAWPNTFYAKQAEYAILRQLPLIERYWKELQLPLIGGGLFLLPGFFMILWQGLKNWHWKILAGAAWFAGYALLYAVRLPVTYQYGRYLIPAMPVYFILGLAGTIVLITQMRSSRLNWILVRAGILSAGLVWLGFYFIGANRYAQDVAIVETEMVIPARWIAENIPAGSLVAAHDIGAVGYFSDRPLVDLAGLITPDVIPIIRDEVRLAEYLDKADVEYLIVFDGWYTHLPDGKEVLYRSSAPFSSRVGGSNMVVYRWK